MKRQFPLGSFVVVYTAAAPAWAQIAASAPPPSRPASPPESTAKPGGDPTWMIAGGVVIGLVIGYLAGVQAGRRKAAMAAP